MKKILSAMLLVLLLFSGCSIKGNEIKPITKKFSTNVEIRHKSLDYKAKLEREDGVTKIIYSFPERLGGLTLSKSKDECKAELFDLSVTSKNDYFTENSAIVIIDSVLNAIEGESFSQFETKIQEKTVLISGEIDENQFEIAMYKSDSKLISISVPNEELTVNFVY